MRKIIFVMSLLFTLCANAQKATVNPKLLDNVYMSISGTAATNLPLNSVFPLNSAASFTVGKNVTPILGFNVQGTAWFGSAHENGTRYSLHQIVRASNVSVNSTVNLFNLFAGYKLRRFDVNTVAGLGWFHAFNNESYGDDTNDLTATTGLDINYHINDAWRVYLEPAVLWNLTNHNRVQFSHHDAALALSLGVTYKFKNSNGTHHFVMYDLAALNNRINQLQEELAKKPKEIVTVKEVTIPEPVTSWTINFAFGSSDLTDEAKDILDTVEGPVSVVGYATFEKDSQAEINQKLSEARAEIVTTYLKSKGIEVLNSVGAGATPYSGRIVTINK